MISSHNPQKNNVPFDKGKLTFSKCLYYLKDDTCNIKHYANVRPSCSFYKRGNCTCKGIITNL